jgi:hypothetical protein
MTNRAANTRVKRGVPRRDVAELTRAVRRDVERQLWTCAAGRCEFAGCNRPLYRSPITNERVNISEKAHIYAFSKRGPRGRGPFSKNMASLNDAANLMLVCHDCHRKIDTHPDRYPAELLLRWKAEHEKRIAIVTGINPNKKSHVLLYGANIGDERSNLQPSAANEAIFPDWYPAEEEPTQLSMKWEGKDSDGSYWKTEAKNLRSTFERQVRPLIDRANPCHFSVFAFAPIPLLCLLGALFTDKVTAEVYQLHREPPTWKWLKERGDFSFRVKRPRDTSKQPVLVISLSDHIKSDRIVSVVGADVSIWELTIDKPHNDFLRSRAQLRAFRRAMRALIVDIGKAHGKNIELLVFPAMPVACAVELGRARMPKADMPWIIFDQNNKLGGFVRALTIGGQNEQHKL